jgi:hypothetical protein
MYLLAVHRAIDEEAMAKGTYVAPVKAMDTLKPFAECNLWEKVTYVFTYGLKVDIHDVVEEDPVVAAIHAHAERFDPKTEYAFSYLQVCPPTCSCGWNECLNKIVELVSLAQMKLSCSVTLHGVTCRLQPGHFEAFNSLT